MIGNLWDAACDASVLVLKKPLESVLQDVLSKKGGEILAQSIAKTTKRRIIAATTVKSAVQTAMTFALKRACGVMGMTAAVSWSVIPITWHIGNKVYLEIERRYVHWIDSFTERFMRDRDITRMTGKPIALILKVASKVPECLRANFVGMAIRAYINNYMNVLVGYELEYAQLANILIRHQLVIENFLLGKMVYLKELVVDLVDVIPAKQLEIAISSFGSTYTDFKKSPVRYSVK